LSSAGIFNQGFLADNLLVCFFSLDTKDVTLLYHLEEGQATKSYGLSVAGLADIPGCVLQIAAVKASEMESNLNWLTMDVKLCSIFTGIMQSLRDKDLNRIVEIINTCEF